MSKQKTNLDLKVNEYGISMLSIKLDKYSVHISTKKVASILNTNNDASMIKSVKYKGRDLYKITHVDGSGSFKVGEKKINAVLENAESIMAYYTKHSAVNA